MYKPVINIPTPPVTPERNIRKNDPPLPNTSRFQYRKSLGPAGIKTAVICSAVGVSIWAYITFQYSQGICQDYS